MIPPRKTPPSRKPPMSDEDFEKNQLAKCDALTAEPVSDLPELRNMALAPAAKNLEVMPRQESTSMIVFKPEEMKALLADFPDSDFRRGAGGNNNLIYLEYTALKNRLSESIGLGQWRFEVVKSWDEKFKSGSPPKDAVRIYIEGRLIIRGVQFGSGIGSNVYYPSNQAMDYGDGYEGAKSNAFRRCCKDFGIGGQAYIKEFQEQWNARYPGFETPKK